MDCALNSQPAKYPNSTPFLIPSASPITLPAPEHCRSLAPLPSSVHVTIIDAKEVVAARFGLSLLCCTPRPPSCLILHGSKTGDECHMMQVVSTDGEMDATVMEQLEDSPLARLANPRG
jgi:hypothetical protein